MSDSLTMSGNLAMTSEVITGDEIIEQARTWLGTPWHHAARCKGVGVDCGGLIVGALQEVGYPVRDMVNYDLGDNIDAMLQHIGSHADAVPEGEYLFAGDILVLRGKLMYNHCGFYTVTPDGDGGILHAWRTPGKVVEHALDGIWEKWIVAVFRLHGTVPGRRVQP